MAIKRGERVTLITKIAAALSGRGWSDIDLILEQFDFPISNSWQGDEYSYVMEHIKRGPDEVLLELHDYLFPADAVAPQSEHAREEDAGGIWQPGFFRLFLSHSSKHSVEMGQLKEALRVFGIDAFVAHNDIEPTQEWRDVIEVGLRTCEAFAAYITPEFRLSEWCDQEVGVALARGILVIPIRRGQTPYGFLGKYQALPGGSKGMPRLAEDIAEVIGQHPFTSKRYTAANETVWPTRLLMRWKPRRATTRRGRLGLSRTCRTGRSPQSFSSASSGHVQPMVSSLRSGRSALPQSRIRR